MATKQGMCRNCGSLIMFDDRDDTCECVFCNCVFPSSEAVEIFENPEGRVFPNEKFEQKAGSHHYSTRVFSNEHIEKTVKREQTKAQDGDTFKKNEFEVSPNDVKAPKKVVALVLGIAAAVIILSIVITLPFYNSRKTLTKKITDEITVVFDGIIEDGKVDASKDGNGYTRGYSIYGQTCQNINIITDSSIDEDMAKELFDRYCVLRADKADKSDKYDGVSMKIYCEEGIYTVSASGLNVKAELDSSKTDKSDKSDSEDGNEDDAGKDQD